MTKKRQVDAPSISFLRPLESSCLHEIVWTGHAIISVHTFGLSHLDLLNTVRPRHAPMKMIN